MDIDINKAKELADKAVTEVAKNEDAKKAVDSAINAVEKKVNTDLPSADDILKTLGK